MRFLMDAEYNVQLSLLADPPRIVAVRIENISGSGLRLALREPIPRDAAVRIDLNDSLLLGEVCYCAPSAEGYTAGIMLEHSLAHLESLQSLRNHLLQEDQRPVHLLP